MNKKGFTLIELLAVIIILAIIALIATPIILNIISDTRDSSNRRSIELYGKSVENKLASNALNSGNIENVSGSFTSSNDGHTLTNGTTTLSIDYTNSKVVCSIVEIYNNGSIYLGECSVNDSTELYSYGVRKVIDSKPCTREMLDNEDVVTCDTESFYVISEDASNITMLSKYNLNVGNSVTDSGSTVTPISNPTGIQSSTSGGANGNSSYLGTVKFSNRPYWSSGYTPFGDSTYVYAYDSNSIPYEYVGSYVTYLSELGISNVSGRLLSYEEVVQLGCDGVNHACSTELYGQPTNSTAPSWVYSISYWLGSTYNNTRVWCISYDGVFGGSGYANQNNYGVRPVITIAKSDVDDNRTVEG